MTLRGFRIASYECIGGCEAETFGLGPLADDLYDGLAESIEFADDKFEALWTIEMTDYPGFLRHNPDFWRRDPVLEDFLLEISLWIGYTISVW